MEGKAQFQTGVDSTGLPGDNFSLQGAIALFQKASSVEEFENLLNSEDNHVNNLDLNGDDEIDYIRVIDNAGADVHAFVLQAVISERESQDVAVIEIEKTGSSSAVLQIIGDEDIFGEQVIVEPQGEDGESAFVTDFYEPASHGPSISYLDNTRLTVNVWLWPSVRFVFGTSYRPWVSPWRWRHYPAAWRPWRPLGWHAFRPFHRHHHPHFVIAHTHRVMRAHRVYTPYRLTSVTVRTRHHASVNGYRVSRSKTTVTGPRGRSATRTRTTVKSPGGNKRAKTIIKRHR
jgi:hypothetical protein